MDTVERALTSLEIDARGLDQSDRRILRALIEKFQGGPAGLSTLAASTAEEMETLEDVIEPFLLQEGLLARPRGVRASKPSCNRNGSITDRKSVV